MNPILKNILAVIAGTMIGGLVNMAIIIFYPTIFPLPKEIIPEDFQTLVDNAHLLEFPHLVSVFLAHGLGTLVGAFIATKLGASIHLVLSLIIGVFFLVGGIMINSQLNFTPLNFSIIDILFAYLPMAWIGWRIATKK